jgi:hypothetical protein
MKRNQKYFLEGCSHYIFIDELSPALTQSNIVGINNFFQIYIPAQKDFYFEFKSSKSKEVILSFEMDKNSIINFEEYFKHSVNLTFHSEIIIENNNILLCKLEDIACF